jgi:hypothetical protein
MSDLTEAARRKQLLIARCAVQRAAIAGAFQDLQGPIAIADRVLAVVQFFRAHPLLLAGAVAVIAALRRRTLVGLFARGLAAWRLWLGIGAWAQRFGVTIPRSRGQARTGHVAS